MNVPDRKLNFKCNYLFEASAGTGKTFAIQHLMTKEEPKKYANRNTKTHHT